VEDVLREKIMVVKLMTGETIIGTVYNDHQNGVMLGHPYEIVIRDMNLDGRWAEVPVLEKYCPYVKNRVFFFAWNNLVYAKEANENFSNIYIEEFARCEHNDYTKLLVTYQEQMTAKQDAKAVAMIGDSMIRIDGDKMFVMGNETKH
jgi:hypothetical protein